MPLDPQVQALLNQLPTATINELPSIGVYGPLAIDDYVPVWLSAFGKSCKMKVQDLKQLIETGGTGSFQPVIKGDTIIHDVTDAEVGGNQVVIPSLSGKTFFLSLEGRPVQVNEFEILNAGGFKMNDVDGNPYKLNKGQRFALTVYELQGGSSQTSNKTSLFTGTVPVNTNLTFDVQQHVNKLLQIRGGATQITLKLGLIEEMPDNSIVCIECMLGNTVEQKIATQAGQKIYMNNTSYTQVSMRAGEAVWLFVGEDGYYVINSDFARIYREIGSKPVASFDIGLNELLCDGSELSRTAYARLYEKVKSLGFSIVDDNTWKIPVIYYYGGAWTTVAPPAGTSYKQVDRPYRGCFSYGDNQNTFRVPDLMNMFLRGVSSLNGNDPERPYNHAGGIMADDLKAHDHVMHAKGPITGTGGTYFISRSNKAWSSGQGADFFGRSPTPDTDLRTGDTGGTETRPINAGVLWVIKC